MRSRLRLVIADVDIGGHKGLPDAVQVRMTVGHPRRFVRGELAAGALLAGDRLRGQAEHKAGSESADKQTHATDEKQPEAAEPYQVGHEAPPRSRYADEGL